MKHVRYRKAAVGVLVTICGGQLLLKVIINWRAILLHFVNLVMIRGGMDSNPAFVGRCGRPRSLGFHLRRSRFLPFTAKAGVFYGANGVV
jgi:hypothetical protein